MNQDMTDESGLDDGPEFISHTGTLPADEYHGLHGSQEVSGVSQLNIQDSSLAHQHARWKRLSKDYNAQYLDFFISDQNPEDIGHSLDTSQYGSVTWTGDEKARLFSALATKGRHNLPDLATAIGAKSVIEVKDYLDRLKAAEVEHQMFAAHAKNASLAEIDAAMEISKELEDKLEQAADALAAFQDKYDLAKARGSGGLWLIDTAAADAIDGENDEREARQTDGSLDTLEPGNSPDEALQMFQLGTMLELSRSIFMNPADGCEHEHWTEYAEPDEEPSLTVDVAQTLYNLTKSLMQRILQTSIFLAKSRIRSTTTSDYTPSQILKDVDVVAALNVLNMPVDVWDYWTDFARRSGVRVVFGGHRKGHNETLTSEQVEAALSVRSSRGRHRSLSSIVSQSSQELESDPERETEVDLTTAELSQSIEARSAQDVSEDEADEESSSEGTSYVDEDDTMEDDIRELNDTAVRGHQNYVSRKRRRIMIEESQDEFLEKLDHANQVREEQRLQEILGPGNIKMEPEDDLPRKPRGQRKTKEDLKDWSERAYRNLWERNKPSDLSPEQSSDAE